MPEVPTFALASLAGLAGQSFRIKASGGHLYVDRDAIVSHPHFFSLFHVIDDASGNMAEGFGLADTSSALALRLAPQDPGLPRVLALDSRSNRERRRRIHWNLGSPPPPSPPPPPPPSPSNTPRSRKHQQAFWLAAAPGGACCVLRLSPDGRSYLRELDGRFVHSRNKSALAPAVFEFEVLLPLRPPSSLAAPAAATGLGGQPSGELGGELGGGSEVLGRAAERSAVSVGGRRVVVATAYNGALDMASLFWPRLGASGVRAALLLSTDRTTCAATRRLTWTGEQLGPRRPACEPLCLSRRDLSLPAAVVSHAWLRPDVPSWETRANMPEERLLRRCKLRLIELLLARRVDVAYLDVDVFILSPRWLPALAEGTRSDLAIGSDTQSGLRDVNYGHCLRIPPMFSRYVSDWVSAGQLYARASEASSWLVRRAARLMDEYVISDADALQAILTGAAQVADPLRAPRAARFERNGSAWIKPLWLEAGAAEPHGLLTLSNHRSIRPINAPLRPEAWRAMVAEREAHRLTWERLAPKEFLHAAADVAARWEGVLGGSPSPRRTPHADGTAAAAEVKTARVSCHLKGWLAEARGAPARRGVRPREAQRQGQVSADS